MRKKSIRDARLSEFISKVLKNAVYEKGEDLDVVVAEAPELPGCVTQGATHEEARENLVDAIEVWLMSGLRGCEDPSIAGGRRRVANDVEESRREYAAGKCAVASPDQLMHVILHGTDEPRDRGETDFGHDRV
jgi:hypothetical protein